MLGRETTIVVLCALLGGCGRDSSVGTEHGTPLPATFAGVYSGELPCSNCTAIEATLWLRPDGTFFLRQTFEGAPAVTESAQREPQEPTSTYGLGRWRWDELAAEAVLRGAGPERRVRVLDDGRLQLRGASSLEHVLERDAIAPRFTDRLALDGESTVTDGGAAFKECLTGLTLPIADAGAYREFRRQHRRMHPRGKPALTTVEGHLIGGGDGAMKERLVVDRFVTIKPGKGC
jgi:hypothetical protein